MKQLNVSKKITSPIMVWVSVVLIAATLLFSFMPIMSFETADSIQQIDELLKEMDINSSDLEDGIPDKIDITVGKLISSIKVMASVVKVASEAAKEASSGNSNVSEAAEKLQTLLESKDGQNTLLVATAIGSTFMNAVDFGGGESSILSIVVNLLLVLIALLIVLVLIFVIPIRIIIMLIKTLIQALSNVKTPEAVATKISSKLPELLAIPFFMMVMQTFVPGMSYGWGLIAICITVAVSVFFCTVISRLRTYETKKFVYLNVVQGASVFSVVGFFLYFFNILKANIIPTYLNKFSEYWINYAAAQKTAKNFKITFTPNKDWITDGILILVFVIFLFASISFISYAANRLSCTVHPSNKDKKLADSKIVFSVLLLATYIIPTIISKAERFCGEYDVSKGKSPVVSLVSTGSYLPADELNSSALKVALAGIIIMIVAEIAILVLKKVLCKDLTSAEAALIVCGLDETAETAPATEAPVAEVPATEEAPAEEAAPEEVSAE